ncbi:MAG: hypothetical protein HPY81_10235 [Firmicutes bacterium]|nr:hypothetical protein [Bacillota bacterium]
MTITQRQKDFLQIIKQIYEATNLPVHYAQVAELLKVSKWSAYEMLKTLEKKGFLTTQYEVNLKKKHPGRARVMFAPAQLANLVLATKKFGTPTPNKEVQLLKERILSLYDKPKKSELRELVEQLKTELPNIENPLVSCAYVIAILILQLQTLSKTSIRLIKNMALDVAKGEIGLAMFVGAVMGSMLKTASQVQLLSHLADSLSGFQKNLATLNQSEQTLLMDFLGEALAKAT